MVIAGLTVMDWVVSFVLHKNPEPLLAISVLLSPSQIIKDDAVIPAGDAVLTVTVELAVAVQEFASVTVKS